MQLTPDSFLYTELCQIEIDTSGQDVARTCLFSYDPEIYFNPNADAFLVDQPQASYKVSNRKNLSGSKQQTPPDGPRRMKTQRSTPIPPTLLWC